MCYKTYINYLHLTYIQVYLCMLIINDKYMDKKVIMLVIMLVLCFFAVAWLDGSKNRTLIEGGLMIQ